MANKFLHRALCEVSCTNDQMYSSISGLTDFVDTLKANEEYQPFLAKVKAFVQLKALAIALTHDHIYNFMSLLKRVGAATKLFSRFYPTGSQLTAVDGCRWLMFAKSICYGTSDPHFNDVERLVNDARGSKERIDASVKALHEELDTEYKELEETKDEIVQNALVIYHAVNKINK